MAGRRFGRVRAGYPIAPAALKGGGIGWRNHDRLPELFSAVLWRMQAGQISDPLRSPAGFHILQLVERRGVGAEAVVKQTRLRHILVRTNEAVSESEARRKLTDLRDRIVNGRAGFGELARQTSRL